MNTFVVVFAGLLALAAGSIVPAEYLAAAPLNLAPVLVRAPAHDSASIESHRLGGNFAYAVAEAHAYAKVTPQLATITHPVAKTVNVHEPAPIATVHPGQIVTVNHIAQPVIEHQPILAQQPVVQARTVVHQPLYKTRTVTQHVAQPVQTVAHVAAPIHAYNSAPIQAYGGHAYGGHAYGGHAYGGHAYGAPAWAYAAQE